MKLHRESRVAGDLELTMHEHGHAVDEQGFREQRYVSYYSGSVYRTNVSISGALERQRKAIHCIPLLSLPRLFSFPRQRNPWRNPREVDAAVLERNRPDRTGLVCRFRK